MKTKSVGERIRNLRKSKKMSQERLAEKLNVSRHSISNWERDVSSPDIHALLEMTELFGVSLNHLFKGDELIVNKYVYAALAFFLGGLGHTDFIENNMVKHYYIYYFVGQVFLVLLE